jgi:hypothetical protein
LTPSSPGVRGHVGDAWGARLLRRRHPRAPSALDNPPIERRVQPCAPRSPARCCLALTLMQNAVSGIYVAGAVRAHLHRNLTINSNKPRGIGTAPKTGKVAWFVVH